MGINRCTLYGFKILGGAQYQNLLKRQKNLHLQLQELEKQLKVPTTGKDTPEARHQLEKSALNYQVGDLRQKSQDYEELQQRIAEDMESITKESGLTRKQIEIIWAERLDLW